MSFRSERRDMAVGLAFLAPNILGVLLFVIFPVAFSLVMAFTNWDLKLHNRFREESLEFIGLRNFSDLLSEGLFVRYLGNTLFFMIGIPVGVAGSLAVALLLNREARAGGGRNFVAMIAGAVMIASVAVLATLGLGGTAMTLLLVSVAAGILLMGVAGGTTIYRTLFYTPHFVAGVATFILWKKLYDPQVGPINAALTPVLDLLSATVRGLPAGLFHAALPTGLALAALVGGWAWAKLRRGYLDGDTGSVASLLGAAVPLIPCGVVLGWDAMGSSAWVLPGGLGLIGAWQVWRVIRAKERFPASRGEGMGSALMLSAAAMVGQFILIGLAASTSALPGFVAGAAPGDTAGLDPPDWLNRYAWAKPALMIMALWAAIGSNNMLLYLAALTGVPQQLYEAAEIDGAGRFARFWHVTWPQLAPTTFFIVVMATIYGLQGGFEMARTMTEGGPAGATTTLSYFIYTEGFETGRLGFASAVAWALFVLVFAITLFNWTFGNRYVNE